MGMYTQIRGWLNVDSIGSVENVTELQRLLEQAKEDFMNEELEDGRNWVCRDTILRQGGNGSKYLFFGTELKNYGNPAYEWIKFLLKYFPNAEGRIDFQYEEEDYWYDLDAEPEAENIWVETNNNEGSYSRYLLIRGGSIIKDDTCRTWCKGYGNMWGKE